MDEIQEILDRLAAIEGSMTSMDQVLKLSNLYTRNHKELSDALAKALKRIDALETNVRALNANRHNKRYELITETPTPVAGTTYELSIAYDPDALFIVFNPVVKVQETALTLATADATGSAARQFQSTVPLVSDAVVIFFSRIAKLASPNPFS